MTELRMMAILACVASPTTWELSLVGTGAQGGVSAATGLLLLVVAIVGIPLWVARIVLSLVEVFSVPAAAGVASAGS